MNMTIVYDEIKIGRKIAKGGDRKVYMYGSDKVVKISTLTFFLGKKLRKKLVYDYAICKKYLPNFVVDTVDVTPSGTNGYIEIQDFIKGEMLTKRHLKDSRVREQFKGLLVGMRQMTKAGYPEMDLMGNRGIFVSRLSNILVDQQGSLRIIDTTLLESKSVGPWGYLFEVFLPLAKVRQKYLIYKFLEK